MMSNTYTVRVADKHLEALEQLLTELGEPPPQLVRLSPHQNTYVTRDHALPLHRRLNEAIQIFQQREGWPPPWFSLRKPYALSARQFLTFLDLVVTIRPLMAGANAEELYRHITAGPSRESPLLVDGVSLYEFIVPGAPTPTSLDPDDARGPSIHPPASYPSLPNNLHLDAGFGQPVPEPHHE